MAPNGIVRFERKQKNQSASLAIFLSVTDYLKSLLYALGLTIVIGFYKPNSFQMPNISMLVENGAQRNL